jgi:hypothetical protein
VSFDTFGFPFKCKKRKKGLNMIWQGVASWVCGIVGSGQITQERLYHWRCSYYSLYFVHLL